VRIVSIVGARPEFIQAAPVSRALRARGHEEVLIHTGQHYDYAMSEAFFRQLGLPSPDHNLGVGSGSHGAQTSDMLARLHGLLVAENPDWVIVRGDTNSTLAGALAAAKLNISLAHIEAGLRSFNRRMPEEINRIVTDHISDVLFCPTENAVKNVQQEGIRAAVYQVGDVMYDAVLHNQELAQRNPTILEELDLSPKAYLILTVHRSDNTDNESNLREILLALCELDEQVIFPVHPRTRHAMERLNWSTPDHVLCTQPLTYFDMLMLVKYARLLLTDSGGLQKEAFFLRTPCVTIRRETEWVETIQAGWNTLVGADRNRIIWAVKHFEPSQEYPQGLYGDGRTSERIVQILAKINNIA
jgi:UDP-GlcNAc3NAcA epimerase